MRFSIQTGLGAPALTLFSGSSEHGRQMNLILEIKTVNNEAALVMATNVTSLILLRVIRLNHLLTLAHLAHNG